MESREIRVNALFRKGRRHSESADHEVFAGARNPRQLISHRPFTMSGLKSMLPLPPEKLKCRRRVNPQEKVNYHGRSFTEVEPEEVLTETSHGRQRRP